MQRCGFCNMLTGVLRRAMCVGSRRGSSESYYRELGDQDTLKIEDKSSDLSDDAEEETSLCRRCHETPRASPRSSPRASPRTSPRPSRQASLKTSPRTSRPASPQPSRQATSHQASPHRQASSRKTSPQPSRQVSRQTSPSTSPRTSRQASHTTSPPPIRHAPLKTSPSPSRQSSFQKSPRTSRQATAQKLTRLYRQASLKTSLRPTRQTSPSKSRRASQGTSHQPNRRASPRPSRRLSRTSPRTSPQISPQTSRRTSPSSQLSSARSSPQSSARCSPQSSARSSPQSSRRTSPKTSPWSSRRSSSRSSPSSSSRFSSRRLSWLRYTKGSRLYYLHSEVQTDSMEERDPEHYEMKMKASPSRFLTMHKRRKKRLLTRCLFNNQALLDDLMLGQVQCILNQSVEWRFNAFTLETVSGGRCLPVLCVHLFQMYGLLGHFQLDPTKAWKLFSLIEEGYHSSNPYHNSIHAADVTQAMHCFLQQKRIRDHLTPLEIMASLLAAIAHDMDHPGVNQPFLIATSNHLATLYKNTSVLENHHWRSAMSCLVESGILDHLPPVPGLRETLENQISSLILATDITRQQEYLTNFKNHLDMDTLDMTKKEHRHLVLQIALKCADISNPCRPWEISRKWSLKVCEEFFRQGDYERRLNLPVTALCDRHTTSIPKIQTGFFKFVVTPLIREWHRFLHNDLSTQMLCNLLYNQNRWETLMNEEANEETKTEISDADMVDDDLDTDNESRRSGSQRLLLPPRRGSLNPVKKKSPFKDQVRRFSVPLNVFQDVTFRHRERSRAESQAGARARRHASAGSSQPSLHSQLSVRGHCSHDQDPDRMLNSEKLLPDSTIASITTPAQAVRLNTVLKEGGNLNKLVRQKTFPPQQSTSRARDDDDFLSRFRPDFLRPIPSTSKKEPKYSYLVMTGIQKTDSEDMSDTNAEVTEPPRSKEKENSKLSRRDSSAGSQLRENLTWVPLELNSDPLLQRRRKSMPGDVLPLPPREKKIREAPTVLPQFLRRTFSGKESWSKRRGSAPSPVAPSELRGLASLGSLRHSVNGGRRKPSLAVTCQQWLAKATYGVQERTVQQFPRRSSLPVEVMTGISTH